MKAVAVALLAVSLMLGTPALAASSAPRDALTEDSSNRDDSQDAIDFVDRTMRKCHQRRVGTSLRVTCQRDGSATFVYEYRVPGRAINMRPRVSASDGVGAEGYRNGKRQYDIHVGFYGRGTYTIDSVRLRLDIPTAYDTRPCVTEGEWARINVWMGGFGGSIKEVAAVFDTNGKRTFMSQDYDGFRFQTRAYKRCGSSKTRKLTFHHNAGYSGWYSYWG